MSGLHLKEVSYVALEGAGLLQEPQEEGGGFGSSPKGPGRLALPRTLEILHLSVFSGYFKRGWGLAWKGVQPPLVSNTTVGDWFVSCASQFFEIF